jgi:hypothetical protein
MASWDSSSSVAERSGMSISLQQLQSSLPTRTAKPQGFWVPYAWLVRSIVEQSKSGRVVMDAVRTVLAREGLPMTLANERTLRVAYYGIRGKEWPELTAELSPEELSPEELSLEELSLEEPPPAEPPPAELSLEEPNEEFVLDEELRLELEREISEGFIPDPED